MAHHYRFIIIVSLILFFLTNLKAQKYKRFNLRGGASVCLGNGSIVDEPKGGDRKKYRFKSVHIFFFKCCGMRAKSFQLDDSYYSPKHHGVSIDSGVGTLIAYANNVYYGIDTARIPILLDTLQIGLLEEKYPFVDLYRVDSLDYSSNPYWGETDYYFDYDVQRWVVTEDYVYLFYIHMSKAERRGTRKEKRRMFRYFDKIRCSVKIESPD